MPASSKSIVLRAFAIVLMAVGAIIWFLTLAFGKYLGLLGGIAAGIAGGACALGGRDLYNRQRRLALVQDGAVPALKGAVVYLRSFGEDSKAAQGISSGVAYGASGLITEEEQLVKSFSSIGPVIAVGEPNEQLPPLGASRLHFRQDEWQPGVQKLLREGALVAIRPGSFSPGVRWEIQQALSHVPPQRLVLIVGGRAGKNQDSDLARFATEINPMLPRPLPTSYSKRRLYTLGTVRAFVRFDDQWNPTLLPVAVDLVPIFRRSTNKRLVPYFSRALQPVTTSLGYPAPRVPVSAAMVIIIGGLGFVFLFGIVQLFAIFLR